MILIIIESPGKIKKIESILGKGYTVKATFGHIQDLDEKSFSIDVDHDYEPMYVPNKTDRSIKAMKDITAQYKKANDIFLFTDSDLEGEFISYSIQSRLKITNPKRIRCVSITEKEIKNVLEKEIQKFLYNEKTQKGD